MATITLRSIKGSPLTITELDDNFTAINNDLGTRQLESTNTGSDILTKLKLVDGAGSGLDADLVDGLNPTSSNTINSLVARDSSGNFAANQITSSLFVGSLVVPTTGYISISGSSSGSILLAVPSTAGSNTITFPATTGTLITNSDSGTVTNAMLAGSIANSKLANSSITIDGNAVSLGGSVSISSGTITWTGAQTFRDNKWTMTDNTDTSKAFVFEVSGVSTSTTRTLTIPNSDGTLATQGYISSGTGAGAFTTLSSTGNTSFNSVTTAGETTIVAATAATGTIQYDALSQSIVYYTSNATGNWTLNIRGNSSTSLNSIMAVGETRTITHLVTQGTTAYYNTTVTIDGSTATVKWQGSIPVAGNVSGIDCYTYSIIKTGSGTFSVLASQVQFK